MGEGEPIAENRAATVRERFPHAKQILGDPPTGTREPFGRNRPPLSVANVLSVRPGGSPCRTGQWPVPPILLLPLKSRNAKRLRAGEGPWAIRPSRSSLSPAAPGVPTSIPPRAG